MEPPAVTLAPPILSSVNALHPASTEKRTGEDIRDEREDLREAAEQTLNAILDLNLDGSIRWVSPSWTDVVGTPAEHLIGVHISGLIISDNKTVFADAVDCMKRDDSKSYRVSFTVQLGPLSKLRHDADAELRSQDDEVPEPQLELQSADLEAQGIMVYDSVTGERSHSMWMIRPWLGPYEIKIDLPTVIVDSLGSGAEVLASYLTRLADSAGDESDSQEPPPVLCRICERHIPPWWFEKHTDLCLQEHRAEMDVQMAQDHLTEHRHAIVRVLDDLEARRSRPLAVDQQRAPLTEYKGMPIGPPPSAQSSPGSSLARSRDRTAGPSHSRVRSFAVRRPQARIVELLMDLCDTAIEISSPAIKETAPQQQDGGLRTQSPQSESRISQVLQWQSPSTNTLEQEQGLALLCADTEKVARAKVDAVLRHRRIIEYSERIRIELAVMVRDCIDQAMRKAARIAAGRLSDSSEEDDDRTTQDDLVQQDLDSGEEAGLDAMERDQSVEGAAVSGKLTDATLAPEKVRMEKIEDGIQREECGPGPRCGEEMRGRAEMAPPGRPRNSPSALATALRQIDLTSTSHRSRSRPTSFVASAGSSSPKECLTPRSHLDGIGGCSSQARDPMRCCTLPVEVDMAGSENCARSSSSASRMAPRTESPMSEFGDLRRAASARQRHRRSLVFAEASSPRRQESPSRSTQPSSPVRIKPRVPLPLSHGPEGMTSPEASPMFPASEFSSPMSHPIRHHRRQSSAAISDLVMRAPPSPRSNASQPPPQPRPAQPSIKDFEIIKPISKGAFGSVYLSKKKSTGEYFAIKVLKKADMVAKNQVGNVKAERAIMMWQGQSDFVAKLYWTFSSKDYLYLVMEYLNGGDCASLIKVLGGLPEEWAKKYLGEVVLGVEHLHERDIIHRDLKPDNLLIDQKGHLKLTDFGLSRMGLIGRQKRALNSDTTEATPDLFNQGPFVRSTSMASSRSTSLDLHGHAHSPNMTPQMTPEVSSVGQMSYFSLASSFQQEPRRIPSSQRSDSGGSEALAHMLTSLSLSESEMGPGIPALGSRPVPVEDAAAAQPSPELPANQASTGASVDSHSRSSSLPHSNMMPPPMALFDPEDTNRRFVGTPDYLAPETIKGDKQDEASDWWSVGCIMFEFLYGIPPFHASEAEEVFENILARKIQWPDGDTCEVVSEEAKDLINKLLCMDPNQRLGANREERYASGGEEIRSHAWFEGINWETLLEAEAQFVPHPENPEDTEYFDARGAVLQSFAEEMEDQVSPQSSSAAGSEHPERPHDALARVRSQVNSMSRKLMPLHIPPHVRDMKTRRLSEPVAAADDFGSFTFKNLPVLEKANKDVIQKLRADALAAQSKPSVVGGGGQAGSGSPVPSLDGSPVLANHLQRTLSNAKAGNRPQSPSGFSHANSSPSRASQPSSPLLVSFVTGQGAEGRRKGSSNCSSLSHQSAASLSLQPPQAPWEMAKVVAPSLQKAATVSAAASPVKGRATVPAPLALSPQKALATPRQGSGVSSSAVASRSRSLTVGSQEASPVASEMLQHRRSRRSQVFDMSPSSSDNEGDKRSALLRVQRRRQSSRRLSQVMLEGGAAFRPLDVLICEDHPVSRMVMEKLLEKLRCRTISVAKGSEAVRYAMSEIQFDVILLEYKLPQISGADVARMIRETKNANAQTPIVAITAYLKELQAPHYFDSLIEKPISSSKLTEVLRSLCQWKPESPTRVGMGPMPHPMPMGLRRINARADDSPTSSISAFAGRRGSAMASSREDSITSSLFGDSESATTDEAAVGGMTGRKPTADWDEGGLGITETEREMERATTTACGGAGPGCGSLGTAATIQQPSQGQADPSTGRPATEAMLWARRGGGDRRSTMMEALESADEEEAEAEGEAQGRDGRRRRGSKPGAGKAVLPSSKLGIEMMRADSHDSVAVGGGGGGGTEGTSGTATQSRTGPGIGDGELADGAGAEPGRGEGKGEEGRGKDETTPRPATTLPPEGSSGAGEEEPTPRPMGKWRDGAMRG